MGSRSSSSVSEQVSVLERVIRKDHPQEESLSNL